MKHVPCIQVNDLTFGYQGNSILDHISFDISQGEYVGIIGPNGGGKTTLVKMILGLAKPHRGEVRLFGTSLSQFHDWNKIGYVPQRISQETVLFPATVKEIVQSGRAPHVRMSEEDNLAVNEAMDIVQVREYERVHLRNLSGGQIQRVFLARALAAQPEILILDEPSAGIDPSSQKRFYQFLHSLHQKGITIVFVSHDIDVMAREVQSVLCINRKMVCYGTPREVLKGDQLMELYGKPVNVYIHDHSSHA